VSDCPASWLIYAWQKGSKNRFPAVNASLAAGFTVTSHPDFSGPGLILSVLAAGKILPNSEMAARMRRNPTRI
jgi:hypothetical protein